MDDIINDFFEELETHNQYFSIREGQPVFLIKERDLYLALKNALERTRH